jgi:hypothetical protein
MDGAGSNCVEMPSGLENDLARKYDPSGPSLSLSLATLAAKTPWPGHCSDTRALPFRYSVASLFSKPPKTPLLAESCGKSLPRNGPNMESEEQKHFQTPLMPGCRHYEETPFSASLSRRFLEELAIRSRRYFRSERRVIKDLPDGFALLLMIGQFLGAVALCLWAATRTPESFSLAEALRPTFYYCPLSFLIAFSVTFGSIFVLHRYTKAVLHAVSVVVIGFNLYNSLPIRQSFGVANGMALCTSIFLGLFYVRAWPHMRLSAQFIQSAGRICWRNRVHLAIVYAVHAVAINLFLFGWCAGILVVQAAEIPLKKVLLMGMLLSFMVTGAFLRDLLQIWLSRIVYFSTFMAPGTVSGALITSISRQPSMMMPGEVALQPTYRLVARESMIWCVGTAARSAFSLVLRAFEIHIWLLQLAQACFPKLGPDANPKCVLDVFHVPTAIYGTSYRKSRRFVAETMFDHGMDRISIDIYIRTFIYYVLAWANGIGALWCLSYLAPFKFHLSCLASTVLALLGWSDVAADASSFAVMFVLTGTVLMVTGIDSVHMILCWAVCETPATVSVLEPELMHVLVADYHARLDLKRLSQANQPTFGQYASDVLV